MIEKEKIHAIVTEDYITSYGNFSVKLNKGCNVWDYKSDIFEHNESKMILAHDEVFGHIIGFIPLDKTDFADMYKFHITKTRTTLQKARTTHIQKSGMKKFSVSKKFRSKTAKRI